jgi:hypothetical protein
MTNLPPPPTTFKAMVAVYALGAYKVFFIENFFVETTKRDHLIEN